MIERITREELKNKLDRGDAFVLVDTLPASDYCKHHLPHAANVRGRHAGKQDWQATGLSVETDGE